MKNTVVLHRGRTFDPESYEYKTYVYLPPLELISLASPLREAGFNIVLLYDRLSPEEQWELLRKVLDDTLYIGISAKTGFEISDSLNLLTRLKKESSEIPCVWGGWHPSILPEETLSDPRVDIVVSGIGQKLSVRIAQRLQKGIRKFSDLPSVKAKPEWDTGPVPKNESPMDVMNIDDQPLPAYDMIDLEFYRCESMSLIRSPYALNLKITGKINYVTSFGCPLKCTYCCNSQIFGNNWAGYSVGKVIKQIKWLAEEHHYNFIEFIDAEFLLRWKRLKAILEGIVKERINIRWASQATVKGILNAEKRGLFPLFVESGCFTLAVGSESGSDSVLKYFKKKQTAYEIIQVGKILAKYDIEASFNTLVGLPKEETEEELYETFKMQFELKKIKGECTFPVAFYTPFPGSVMYNDAIAAGYQTLTSLEAWGKFDPTYNALADSMPWRNKSLEKLIKIVITFYIPLAVPADIHRGTINYLITHLRTHPLKFIIKIAHKLALFRMEKMLFKFPFEYHFYMFWLKIRRIRAYQSGGRLEVEKPLKDEKLTSV